MVAIERAGIRESRIRFVMSKGDERARILSQTISTWESQHPEERISASAVARSIGVGPDTVSRAIDTVLKTDPNFPDPRRKTTAPLGVESSNIVNVTKSFAYKHPETYAALGLIIGRSGVPVSSRRARTILEQAGIRIRVERRNGVTRYFAMIRDEGVISSQLQHLLFRETPNRRPYSLDNITRRAVQEHPEVFTRLGKAFKKAGVHINPQRIPEMANRLTSLGFKIGSYETSEKRNGTIVHPVRYCVMTKDLPELVAYLRKSRWIHRITSVSQEPSTSPRNSA